MNERHTLTEENDNVVLDLEERRKARKGLGGGGPPDVDWLSPMKLGSEFLVRPKQQKTWILAKFMQAGCKDGNVLLIPMKGEEVSAPESDWIWCDPVEFCRFWEFRGYVLIPIEEEKDE